MKYKVGDKVRVKQTLNRGQKYGWALANDAMVSKSGEFVTIEEVLDNGYHIKEDIWYWTDEMLEPVSTDKPKFKVGDKVRVKNGFFVHELYDDKQFEIKKCDNSDYTYLCKDIDVGYSAWFTEEALELVYQDGGYVPYGKLPTPSQPVPIEAQLGLPKGVSIHDLNTVEWRRPSVNIIFNVEQAEELAKRIKEKLSGDKIGLTREYKEDKPMEYTFKTKEYERIDRTCNQKVKTITTYAYGAIGEAYTTCDEKDYDAYTGALVAAAKITASKSEEAGLMYNLAMKYWSNNKMGVIDSNTITILQTLADRAFCGKFENSYKRWQKQLAQAEKWAKAESLKCKVCGETFDTEEKARAHEQWHIDNKRKKYENYLIRKEAKRRMAENEKEQKINAAIQKIAKENK